MTLGDDSMSGVGRLRTQLSTAQMARHCGHHRNRLPLRNFLRTSTGTQRHSGQDTATSSGLSIRRVRWGSEGATYPVGGTPSRSRRTQRVVAWSATRPLASARPPHGDTTEHLQCQRGHVQTPAGSGIVAHDRRWIGGIKSPGNRNTADTDLGASGAIGS
jgi:hypothetical protein